MYLYQLINRWKKYKIMLIVMIKYKIILIVMMKIFKNCNTNHVLSLIELPEKDV